MKTRALRCTSLTVIYLFLVSLLAGAQDQGAAFVRTNAVPGVITYSGVLKDSSGQVRTSVTGATFLLYRDEQGSGAPLWMETQNVIPDKSGHYTVQLGATTANGIPANVFQTGEARWLAVRVAGEAEQSRVLLVSVPYAMKAGDAATIGGLPPSAFVLAAAASNFAAGSANGTAAGSSSASPTGSSDVTTTGGTVNAVPLWTTATNVQSSAITQTGSGTTAKIGINSATPAATLDVKGSEIVRGNLGLGATGVAGAAAGKNSQPQTFTASAFNSASSAAVNQSLRWQAEPAGNNTASPSATLNLLYASGSSTPTETGLRVGSNGQISFAVGQAFPGAGTISGVTAGTDLTGGGASGSVTLNLDTTKVPQLKAANTFTGNQTVNGNLTSTGVVTGSSFQIGSNLFAFGSYANFNAFLGFAGNSTTTGGGDTATGFEALHNNSSGANNTAHGFEALLFNTAGSENAAFGEEALQGNSTGSFNAASGGKALLFNTTGNNNTGSGYQALYANQTGTDNTAVGYQTLYYNKVSANTAVGSQALMNNFEGTDNSAIGYKALYANTTGHDNTANGYGALAVNTTGYDNAATGAAALSSNTTGYQNSANGYQALYSNTTGYQNTASGYQALYSNVGPSNIQGVGIGNTADGYQALYANNTGSYNTANGYQALGSNTSGAYNTASGYQALYSTNGSYQNTAFGYQTLYSNTTGIFNTAIGMYALTANAEGAENTAGGWSALAADTGGGNTAFGYNSLASNTSGIQNTAVGAGAGSSNTTGQGLTCIGYNCTVTNDGLSNATAIGAHARVGASNALVLGGTGQYAVKVGIGTETPSNILTIAQGAGHPVSDSWETYSSRRWKTNIHTLPNALAKIEQLRGVSYDMKDSGKHEIGVIAEEVGAVVPELVSYEANGKDARSVDYARLTALLIEATKQQQREIEKLKSELRETRQTLRQVKAQMAKSPTTLLATK